MNKNEIRGYIFTGFALLCLACKAIMSTQIWGYSSETYYQLLTLCMIVCIGAAVICFVWAYNETKYSAGMNKLSSGKIHYRPGQSWTEVNLF